MSTLIGVLALGLMVMVLAIAVGSLVIVGTGAIAKATEALRGRRRRPAD